MPSGVFSLRGDHAQFDIPLVADMARWCPVWEVGGGHVEQTTAAQCLDVVDRSVVRVGHPGQVARVDADNLDVQPDDPVLARVQLRMIGLGPALKEGVVDDQLGRGTQSLRCRYAAVQGSGDQGRVDGDDAGGGGLGASASISWGRLCLR